MKLFHKLLAVGCAAAMLCASCLAVSAQAVPDLTRSDCAIHLTMRENGKAVPGGTITLYRVADAVYNSDNFSFALAGDFIDAGVELGAAKLGTAELAQALADYAAQRKLAGTVGTFDQSGEVRFENLTAGLYLLAGYSASDNGRNYTASPFLVTVPLYDAKQDVYSYDVDATPKVEADSTPTPPGPGPDPDPDPGPDPSPDPETPDAPQTPETPITPDGPQLPQTGQLNWPVPVLAVAGLMLLLAGWALRFGKKKDGYEK